MTGTLFEAAEYAARLAAVRDRMDGRGIDLLLLSAPENIVYLTGLDHWGYFAPHVLVVPRDGGPVLVTRAMERVTVAAQVTGARFEGHSDAESAADGVLRAVAGLRFARVGIEAWSSGLPHGLAEALKAGLPNTAWTDASGLVDGLRLL
ncbi:MAG TPA: aminopeptidase P family N-terminal domain-containing protein, partial [Thalassobaculum sp.]